MKTVILFLLNCLGYGAFLRMRARNRSVLVSDDAANTLKSLRK